MARGNSGAAWRRLDGLLRGGTIVGLDEPELLDRFVTRRDPVAFEAIVARHGAMVWGVCSRTLRDPHDAEDAFQATFLILAARAGAIRHREKLGGWLHGVAAKVAKKARQNAARRRTEALDAAAEIAGKPDSPERRDQIAELHEELARLPGKYREPIVLCHLEGCTHDEAADRLGWPVGTVRGRLARGRERLKQRLTRRGLTVPVLAFEKSRFPSLLLDRTVSAATDFAAGQTVLGLLSTQGAGLVTWGLRAMLLKKLTMLGLVGGMVLFTGAAVVGGARLVDSSQDKDGDPVPSAKPAAPKQAKPGAVPVAVSKEDANAGVGENKALQAAATKAQEIAELQEKANDFKTLIHQSLQRLNQLSMEAQWTRGRLANFDYESARTDKRPLEAAPAPTRKEDETRIEMLPAALERVRTGAIQTRVELAKVEARIAELQKDADDTTAKIAEAAAQDEAQLEILSIEAEQAKSQWEEDLQEVRQWEGRLLPNRLMMDQYVSPAKTPEEQQRRDKEQAATRERIGNGIDQYQKRAAESRERFLKLRTEVAKIEARLHAAGRSVPSGSRKSASSVEQRLSRIEQALERLEQLEKQGQVGRGVGRGAGR